jgi:hypothetical protein
MTSVPDTPGDMDDDLSGVSPELVLIDPDLAQKLRERGFDPEEPRAASAPVLRLVRARPVEAREAPAPVTPAETIAPPAARPPAASTMRPAEPPTPPRTMPVEPSPAPRTVAPAPAPPPAAPPPPPAPANLAERLAGAAVPAARHELVAPTPAERIPPPVVETRPVVEQSPVVEPPPSVVPSPAIEPVAPEQATLAAPQSVMPHPVARTAAARVIRNERKPRRRGRGMLGFAVAVAVASAAVLGITNLTGGSVPGLADGNGSTPAGSQRAAASKPKATAKNPGSTKAVKRSGGTQKQAAKRPARPPVAKPKKTPPATAQAKSSSKPSNSTPPKPKPSKAAPTPRQAAKPAATSLTPATKPAPNPAPAASAVEPRRFAWAPVDGAVAYHVELFKGPDRVFARDTSEPVLELAPTWRHEGKAVALTPGTYRWYVWPVTKSGRATQAVVQAKLTVP